MSQLLDRFVFIKYLVSRYSIYLFFLTFLLTVVLINEFKTDWVLLGAIVGVAFVFLSFRNASLAFLGISLAVFAVWFNGVRYFSNVENRYGDEVYLQATVLSDVVELTLKTRFTVIDDGYGKVLIEAPMYPRYVQGDNLLISGELLEPPEYEDFSYKEYLKIDRVNYVIKNPIIDKNRSISNNSSLYSKIIYIRNDLIIRIDGMLPEPHSSLLKGLVLGIRTSFPDSLEENLQITGTSHIVAVSGYNVSLIILFLFGLSGFLPRKVVVIITPVFLLCFLVLVGVNNTPALRAVLMGLAIIFSLLIGRKSVGVNTLFLIIFFMVIENPLILRSVSFQLSIAATLGILLFGGIETKKLNFVPSGIRDEFKITLIAVVATLPLVLYSFGGVSLHGILINMLILPVVPIITILGILGLFISYVFPFLVDFIMYFEWVLLDYVISMINWGGRFQNFYLEGVEIDLSIVIFSYLVMLIFYFEISYKRLHEKLCTNKLKYYSNN